MTRPPLAFTALPDDPLVSVCVAAHNAAPYITDALRSILDQTYPRLEIIVIDDASTDATPAALRRFRDPRLTVVTHAVNAGGYETMNEAIGRATGDPIAVFHADDVYGPEIVAREVDLFRRHPEVGAVFTENHMMAADGRRKGTNRLPEEFRGRDVFDYETVFRYFLRRKNTLLCCPTFMTRRATVEAVGPFDAARYHVAADLDMWIRILQRCPIGIVDEPLMSYRHSNTQWSQRYKRLRTDQELHFDILDRYLTEDPALAARCAPDLVDHEFHRVDDQTFRAANAMIKGEAAQARALLALGRYPWRSLRRRPSRRRLRVLTLRAALHVALWTGTASLLGPVLARTEH